MMKRRAIALGLLLLFLCVSSAVAGLPTRKAVLAAVYRGAEIEGERVFLTQKEVEEVAKRAGVEVESPLVARYIARKGGKVIGRAYVDTHIVRTKKESLLVCLDAEGKILRIEVTAFLEPPEYKPSQAWYGQYGKKGLSDDLHLGRGIHPVAGATLTAIATNRAARRVLAIDAALAGREGKGGAKR